MAEVPESIESAVRVLWAKSPKKSKRPRGPGADWHPLVAHIWDSAAVAGWLWENRLPPAIRDLLGGQQSGRDLYRWLAALHDLGKASVAFQTKVPRLSAAVNEAGLPCGKEPERADEMPHGRASGLALVRGLEKRGWSEVAAEWLGLIVGGHHGKFPEPSWLDPTQQRNGALLGGAKWTEAREHLITSATEDVGFDLAAWRDRRLPLAAQLVLSGAVILADWLASTEELFPYAGGELDGYRDLEPKRLASIPEVTGWRALWRPDATLAAAKPEDLSQARFGCTPWPVQAGAMEVAGSVTGPGILLIEATMGEGKTEAALLAAEVLAARFGQRGVFVGLPTQATANQAFGRICEWLRSTGQESTVALAHGGARRVEEYERMLVPTNVDPGDDDDSLISASEWFTRQKALLAPVTVGTVDQLLFAGVAVRHVALRHLGLAGKVVIVDEVHAYDAYMSLLLRRVLAWLGQVGTPVILLSATLPSSMRRELLSAYAGSEVSGEVTGYPRLTWADAPGQGQASPVPSRAVENVKRSTVRVELRAERQDDPLVPDLAVELAGADGCVLVLRNTVGRAQDTYRELVRRLGPHRVTLFHARFTAADRRDRENLLTYQFGKDRQRPTPHIVVATQVVEQSLDVDFDAIITDLAPIDLLLQRLGRVHRHERPDRPERLCPPSMYVVGHESRPDGPPRLPPGIDWVYHRWLLWRTAAVLAEHPTIELPRQLDDLVEAGYGDGAVGPSSWQEPLRVARQELKKKEVYDQCQARSRALPGPHEASLAHLHVHAMSAREAEDNPWVQSQVRLGQRTVEVLLLRETGDSEACTPASGGDPLSLAKVPSAKQMKVLLDQAIRLPPSLTDAVDKVAQRPSTWQRTPWLRGRLVLRLPVGGEPLPMAGYLISYTSTHGLEVTRAG